MKDFVKRFILIIVVCFLPALLSFTSDEQQINNSQRIEQAKIKLVEKLNPIRLDPKAEVIELPNIKVTITMYEPTTRQTDATPHITADGTMFVIERASDYNYVALSRNLLKRWGGTLDYGDFISIEGANGKSGIYQIRDTMHPRFVNYVDILESPGTKPYKFRNAKIKKIDPAFI